MTDTTTDTQRAKAYDAATGLRQLADLICKHPELADLADERLLMYVSESFEDDAEPVPVRFARLSKTLGGDRTKKADDHHMMISRMFGPLKVEVFADRAQVCERVEVGTETVEVVDPAAPKVTVERPVYRWDCKPVLGEVS